MKSYNGNLLNSNIHYFYYPIEFFFRMQKKLGLNEVALYGCVPHIWIDHYGIDDAYCIRDKATSNNIKISLFIPKEYFYFISSPDEKLAARSVEYYKNCINFCEYCGIKIIYIKTRFIKNLDLSSQKEQYRKSRESISKYAEEKNIKPIYDEKSLKSEGYIILTDYRSLTNQNLKTDYKVVLLDDNDTIWSYPHKFDEKNVRFFRGE